MVRLPHTWNVEDGSEEYWGTGWYQHELSIPSDWREKRIWVHFGAVYHHAVIYLNGIEVGKHAHSGYTSFTVELTPHIRPGAVNLLMVKVSNAFSAEMLPYRRSFDWANDGGLIREVSLYTTGRHALQTAQVTAQPVIPSLGERREEGAGRWGLEVTADGPETGELSLSWELYGGPEGAAAPLLQGSVPCAAGRAAAAQELPFVRYWHFDSPTLYTVKIALKSREGVEDTIFIPFGFRDFHVEGNRFYLNGEAVRICGTEWMPGSNPDYGMAEPKEQLEKMLVRLKESNCVFTRFHWQQDDFVYDWCDQHGMLVQEEVPFWGRDPEVPGEQQL